MRAIKKIGISKIALAIIVQNISVCISASAQSLLPLLSSATTIPTPSRISQSIEAQTATQRASIQADLQGQLDREFGELKSLLATPLKTPDILQKIDALNSDISQKQAAITLARWRRRDYLGKSP